MGMKPGLLVIWLCLNFYLAFGEYFSVISKLDQAVYLYPNQIRSEKQLRLCDTAESVCGVVNKRFWLPSLVHRLCRCPDSQCPFAWSQTDNRSVPLDNRSQLKLCTSVNNVELCGPQEIGLTVSETTTVGGGQQSNKIDRDPVKDVRLHCRCDWPSYWRLTLHLSNATATYNEYVCSKFYKCQSGAFCGHVRKDTYSAYYQCSCPKDHLCINTDGIARNVSELLYKGPVFRAHCVKNEV